MISTYFIAKRPQTNGLHLIHKEGCPFIHEDDRSLELGNFNSGNIAITEARKHYNTNVPCRFCMKEHLHNSSIVNLVQFNLSEILPTEEQIAKAIHGAFLAVLN